MNPFWTCPQGTRNGLHTPSSQGRMSLASTHPKIRNIGFPKGKVVVLMDTYIWTLAPIRLSQQSRTSPPSTYLTITSLGFPKAKGRTVLIAAGISTPAPINMSLRNWTSPAFTRPDTPNFTFPKWKAMTARIDAFISTPAPTNATLMSFTMSSPRLTVSGILGAACCSTTSTLPLCGLKRRRLQPDTSLSLHWPRYSPRISQV